MAPNKGVNQTEEETPVGEEDLAPEGQEIDQTPSAEADENEFESEEEIPEELPSEPDKQREAFIKMRQKLTAQEERLEELEQQRQAEEERERILGGVRGGSFIPPQNLPPITPDTPIEEVTQHLTQAQREALLARQEVKELRAEMEDKEAYERFPELKTDPDFLEDVSALYIKRNLEASVTGKKPITVSQAAEIVKKRWEKVSESQKTQAAEKAVQELSLKERASLEARGSSVNIQRPNPKLVELRERVKRGDSTALSELVKLRVLGEE